MAKKNDFLKALINTEIEELPEIKVKSTPKCFLSFSEECNQKFCNYYEKCKLGTYKTTDKLPSVLPFICCPNCGERVTDICNHTCKENINEEES